MPANPLDRSSALPLWAQLEQDLRRRLDANEFDEVFPTDVALTAEYDVSRHTVREAIRHLNRAGILRRVRGRGTVVNRAEFEQSLGTLYSLFQSIERAGVTQTSEVLEVGPVTDPNAASHLGLPEDQEVFHLRRLRLAGGEPLAIDCAWLRADIGVALTGVDWSHTALYAELGARSLPVPNRGWERLMPIVPSGDDHELLGMAQGDAAFHLERLGMRDDKVIEWRTTTIRGDRYRFVADWSTTAPSQLRPAAME